MAPANIRNKFAHARAEVGVRPCEPPATHKAEAQGRPRAGPVPRRQRGGKMMAPPPTSLPADNLQKYRCPRRRATASPAPDVETIGGMKN